MDMATCSLFNSTELDISLDDLQSKDMLSTEKLSHAVIKSPHI